MLLRLILVVFCLIVPTISEDDLFPFPCSRYSTHLEVVGKFLKQVPQFDTVENYQLRRKHWQEGDGSLIEAIKMARTARIKVKRSVTGIGMHRKVDSCFLFDDWKSYADKTCWLMARQQVPSSFFIDIYQLERSQTDEGNKYFFERYMDIEAPEYESTDKHHTVLIFSPVHGHPQHVCHSTNKLEWHIRYHRPSSRRHVNVTLPLPQLFIYCQSPHNDTTRPICADPADHAYVAPCPQFHKNQSVVQTCQWTRLDSIDEDRGESATLTFQWPVGDPAHERAVTIITLLVTTTATLIITFAVITLDTTIIPNNKKFA